MRETRTRALALASLLAAIALATASCSSGSTAGTSSAAAAPAATSAAGTTSAAPASTAPAATGPVLTISGFSFSALSVKAGTTVTVQNMDSVNHTVKIAGTGVDVRVPATGQATFTAPAKPGSYPLTCDFHAHMHGVLTVTA